MIKTISIIPVGTRAILIPWRLIVTVIMDIKGKVTTHDFAVKIAVDGRLYNLFNSKPLMLKRCDAVLPEFEHWFRNPSDLICKKLNVG